MLTVELSNGLAVCNLDVIYEYGTGVDKNILEAREFNEEARRARVVQACLYGCIRAFVVLHWDVNETCLARWRVGPARLLRVPCNPVQLTFFFLLPLLCLLLLELLLFLLLLQPFPLRPSSFLLVLLRLTESQKGAHNWIQPLRRMICAFGERVCLQSLEARRKEHTPGPSWAAVLFSPRI